jgi:hypothetical protein
MEKSMDLKKVLLSIFILMISLSFVVYAETTVPNTGAVTTTNQDSAEEQSTFAPTPTPPSTSCGTIYNIAGFGLGIQTTTTRIYDIATNSWNTGTPIPEANGLADHAIGYWNGKIYIAGGYNGSGAINTLRSYDIATDAWSTLASMPQAVFLSGFGVINGKFYVASGNSGSSEISNLQIYDIATNAWSAGPAVPTPVTGPGSAVFNGKLYLFGGAAPFPTATTITQIYDPGTNAWSSGPSLNTARFWFYGTNINNASIVAIGGDTTAGIPGNVNEQLTGGTWNVRAALPDNARGPFVVSDGTYVYIGGGFNGTTVSSGLLRYDPVADSYTPLASSGDGHDLSQAIYVPCTATGAVMDIKFCSNPNGFNCKNNGVVPVTIFGTADLDVSQIDLSTVKLCLASNTSQCINLVDAGFPKDRGNPTTDLGTNVCTLGLAHPDGLDDLDVTFGSPDLASLISCSSINKKQASPALIIEGNLQDGTPFQTTAVDDIGIDELLIQKK